MTRALLIIGLIAHVLVGCARQQPDAPPQVHYGRDECAHCGMILSDERTACALRVTADGKTSDLLFDDIGDMLAYERANAGLKIAARYVHDFDTRQWLPAEGAKFIRSEDIHTPMGSGIAAFSDATRARNHQRDQRSDVVAFAIIAGRER